MYEFAKNALDGKYQLDIKSLIDRANSASKQNMSTLLLALLTCFFIIMVYAIGFLSVTGVETPEQLELLAPEKIYIAQIMLVCITAPIFVALTMIGVKTERKESVRVGILFSYFSSLLFLAVATILVSFLTQIGLALLWVPGLYIMVTTSFTQTLIVDKGLSPISALILSVKVSNVYLLKLIQLYLLFLIMFIGVIITFGFALIWVGPLYFNIKAILYNDLFQQKSESITITDKTEEDAYFDA
ncbi:hypothetical protein ISG33_05410 [Glaciecola sp. MH2013]|uniref:hypothetical protein n=1 Tax=Glaciecola sp. MH2013 TaxID=2785524 RepID=UPI00189D745E|nr:hypothetical protein [Glaciecola sp. MH2013]MBF7072839.1 hypothetical protein [Glaciecola sp. MH2013]